MAKTNVRKKSSIKVKESRQVKEMRGRLDDMGEDMEVLNRELISSQAARLSRRAVILNTRVKQVTILPRSARGATVMILAAGLF